jgi:hypothetical protein
MMLKLYLSKVPVPGLAQAFADKDHLRGHHPGMLYYAG